MKILPTNEQKPAMSDIYNLLNLDQGMLKDFHLQANRVADHQTEKVVHKNMSKLKQIEECMSVEKGLVVAQQSIDEVISKVIRMAPSGDTSADNWTIRELRIVSYYLMKLRDDSINYMYALELLDHNWRNIFFNGLVFYLLDSWHRIEPDYRASTSGLLMRKLGVYSDSYRIYNLWKNRLNLFDSNGPARMAAMLSAKNMSLEEAPTLLGFKESSLTQSYYSDVIIKYIVHNEITDRDSLEHIFELHNLDRTKKLTFAYLVEKENKIGDEVRRSLLCRFANAQLGDVTLASSWAPFTGATEAEAQKLKQAMQLVNMWFAQQIIETFFEICVQDKERKNFWMKYVNNISDFRIIGSTATKQLLQGNSKIGEMLSHYFIETYSRTSQTSALVLFIKNKMIVEFSDAGALYVYNKTSPMVRFVTEAGYKISSTDDLKISSMIALVGKNYLGEYTLYNEQGRMTHQGYWQQRLEDWMNYMIQSSQNTSVSFMENKHDDIFKAKPLPAEDFKPLKEYAGYEETDSSVAEKIEQNVTSQSTINETQFSYNIASKTLDSNVRIVANANGFYLALGKDHYQLIKSFASGESPTGNIWIKKAVMKGWNEIVHNYFGSDVRSIGFIRISTDEVTYKESLSVASKTKYKIY